MRKKTSKNIHILIQLTLKIIYAKTVKLNKMGGVSTKLRKSKKDILLNCHEMPIHRLYENELQHHKQNVAIVYLDFKFRSPVKMTHENLNKFSNKCARFLIKMIKKDRLESSSLSSECVVAICIKPSIALIIALLAVWKAGAAHLTLDLTLADEEIKQILNDSNPILILYDGDFEDDYLFSSFPTFPIQNLLRCSCNESPTSISKLETLSEENINLVAAIMYTSGNRCASPKGVRISHKAILNRPFWQWKIFPYSRRENITIFNTSANSVESLFELWSPLIYGLAVLIVPNEYKRKVNNLVNIMEEFSIFRITLMPNLLVSLLYYLNYDSIDHPKKSIKHLNKIKYWFCTGEELTKELALQFYKYFDDSQELVGFYGCTEMSGDIMYFRCNKEDILHLKKIPIGYPISNTQIFLIDESMKLVRPGEAGELCISGFNVAVGYTSEDYLNAFVENPFSNDPSYERLFRTGDLCSESNGCVIYKGRKENEIEFRGQNFNTIEVERLIAKIPYVENVIAILYNPEYSIQKLLVFVKLLPNSPFDTKQNLHDSIQILPNDLSIEIISIQNFPLLPSGKIDRFSLHKCYNEVDEFKRGSSFDVDFPNMSQEMILSYKDLYYIITTVLRSTEEDFYLNVEINFFELGYKDIDAVSVVILLRQKGYTISLLEFVTAKNLGDVLKIMSSNSNHILEENYVESFPNLNISIVSFKKSNKSEVIRMMSEMKIQTEDLHQFLHQEKGHFAYKSFLNDMWEHLEELSFIIKDDTNDEIQGFSLNMAGAFFPHVHFSAQIEILISFYEFLLEPLRTAYLFEANSNIFFSFLTVVNPELHPSKYIACYSIVESEKVRLAKYFQYSNMLWINGNFLTQLMACDVFYYKILLDYQINRYITSDGYSPFKNSSDSKRILINWKIIGSKID